MSTTASYSVSEGVSRTRRIATTYNQWLRIWEGIPVSRASHKLKLNHLTHDSAAFIWFCHCISNGLGCCALFWTTRRREINLAR